ncbi:MAG: hypothetical protein WD403_05460 [Pirellulales bacterium]
MLILITLLGVALGARVYRSGLEARFLAAVRASKAGPSYDGNILHRPGIVRLWLGDKHLAAAGSSFTLHSSATDESLQHLAELDSLRSITYLDAAGSQITDAGLATLASLPALKDLSVASTAISDAGLKHVAALKALQELDLTATGITDQGVFDLWNEKPDLRVMIRNYGGMIRGGDYAGMITGLPTRHPGALTRSTYEELVLSDGLDLGHPSVTGASLRRLSGAPRLRTLSLINSSVDDAAMEGLPELQSLERLELANTRVTDRGLHHLERLPNLKSLHLSGSGITDAGLEVIGRLVSLEHLVVMNTNVTDAGLVHLVRLPHLHSVNLLYLSELQAKVTDRGLETLVGCAKLESLEITSTQITDAALVHLKRLSHLKVLRLHGNPITDVGAESLGDLTGLRSVWLDGTKVTAKGAQALRSRLPNCEVFR